MARQVMLRRIVWSFPLLLLQASAQAPGVCVIGGCHSQCLNTPLLSGGRNKFPCAYGGNQYTSCPASPTAFNYGTQISKADISLPQCVTPWSPDHFFDIQHTDLSAATANYNNFAEYADAPALVNGATAWNDRTYYYDKVDPVLSGTKFFVGTHKSIKSGWVHFSTSYAGDLYVFAEKTGYTTEGIRDAGFSTLDWASVGGELTDLSLSYDGETGCPDLCQRVYGDMAVWKVPMQAFQRVSLPVTPNLRWTGGMAFEPNFQTTSTTTTTGTSTTSTVTTTTSSTTLTGSSTTTTTSTVSSTTSTTTATGSTTTFTTTTRTTTVTTTTVSTTTVTRTTTSSTTTNTKSTTTLTTTTKTTTSSTVSSTTTTTQTTTSTTRTTTSTTTSTTTVTTTTFHGNVLYQGSMSFQLDDCDAAVPVVSSDDGKDALLSTIGSALGVTTQYSTITGVSCESRRLGGDLRGARRMASGSLGVTYNLLIGTTLADNIGLTRESIATNGASFSSGLSNILAANNVTVNILGVSVPVPTARIVYSDPFASTSTTTTTTTTTGTTTTRSTTTGDIAAWDKPPGYLAADGGAAEHAASGSNAILFLGTCAIMCVCSICCAKKFFTRVMPQAKEVEGDQHEEDISHMSAKKSPKKKKVRKMDEFGGECQVEIDILPAAKFAPGRSMTLNMTADRIEDGHVDEPDQRNSMTTGFTMYMDDEVEAAPTPVSRAPVGLTPRQEQPQPQANDTEYEKFSDSKSVENKSVEGAEAEDSVAPLRGPAASGAMSQAVSLGEDSAPTMSSI